MQLRIHVVKRRMKLVDDAYVKDSVNDVPFTSLVNYKAGAN